MANLHHSIFPLSNAITFGLPRLTLEPLFSSLLLKDSLFVSETGGSAVALFAPQNEFWYADGLTFKNYGKETKYSISIILSRSRLHSTKIFFADVRHYSD